MNSCNACGMRFADGDTQCPACGSTDFTPDKPAKGSEAPPPPSDDGGEKKEKKKKDKKKKKKKDAD